MMKDINHWFVLVTSYNPGQRTLAEFVKNSSKTVARGDTLKRRKPAKWPAFGGRPRRYPQFT
jgi:hypothetical protein